MRDYITLGSTPHREPCAQVGSPDYHEATKRECTRFIALLREIFGPEPPGAIIQVKSFNHDLGTYHEVVCWYDETIPDSVKYAFACESGIPETWEDNAKIDWDVKEHEEPAEE